MTTKRIANKLVGQNCSNEMLNSTKDFIMEHFYWVKINLKNLSLESILKEFRQLVFQRGINICVIDPWNMLDHTTQRDFGYIGHKLSLLTQFVQQTNTHLFLVAHPKKIESENGQFQKVDLYKMLYNTKLPKNLHMMDRVSMQSSIELRCPFIDKEILSSILPSNSNESCGTIPICLLKDCLLYTSDAADE